MKYSFVIPTYNNREGVIKALDCLIRLTNSDDNSFEIIVVDDGSTDNTYSAVSEYKSSVDIRVIFVERTKTSCRAKARNIGWEIARGEIIVFIDSDILVKDDYLQELDRYFNREQNIIVIGCRKHIRKRVERLDILSGNIFSKSETSKDAFENLDYRYLVFSAESFNGNAISDPWLHAYSCNFAVRKKWLIVTGGFDEYFQAWGLEDLELAYRIYQLGVKIYINPNLEVLHQSCYGHFDDIKIRESRLADYKNNISYFLKKHPEALQGYDDPYGLLIDGKNYRVPRTHEKVIKFYKTDDVQVTKDKVLLYVAASKIDIVFEDYDDYSDFDYWVQSLNPVDTRILYFPMSKKVDVEKMILFLERERSRITPRNSSIPTNALWDDVQAD